MTDLVMIEITEADTQLLVSLPTTLDYSVIWDTLNKLCGNGTKVRFILSKDGFGTKETEVTWPASIEIICSALDEASSVVSTLCKKVTKLSLSSLSIGTKNSILIGSYEDKIQNLSLISLVRVRSVTQSITGLEVRIHKKRYLIGLCK